MSDAGGNLIVVAGFVSVLVLLRVASGSRRRGRRTLERAAATTPVAPKPVPARKPAPAPVRTPPAPARAAAPPRAAGPRTPAPVSTPATPLLGRAAGPRWAASAIVAAEVFGPPVAARPGGTLGPPNAL